jgi:hypothetical protein
MARVVVTGGSRNVVWASSETLLGLPFDEPPPYFPVDEEYGARPQSGYSLSKFVGRGDCKAVLQVGSGAQSRLPAILQCYGTLGLRSVP